MIIQLSQDISENQYAQIKAGIRDISYQSNEVKTRHGHYFVCIGKKEFDIRKIGMLPGVKDVHRVSDNYKLVSSKWKVDRTKIDLGEGVVIGNGALSIMAGPCSIESEEQIESVVEHLVKNEVKIMRGGVFKPRSSPYSFRGMGIEGLKLFHGHCRKAGIKIVTEVMQVSQIRDMEPFIDIFQVGARNCQNFNLLDALGETDKAVLLKRGMSISIEELLHSAEYIFSNGNERILLCERGIRTYESAYRNTLDLNAVPILKDKSHLPVIVDPSHGIGIRAYVSDMALAGIAAGADGIITEIHPQPEKALSDGQQTLAFDEAERLYKQLRKLYHLRGEFEHFQS